MKTRAYKKDIGKYYNMVDVVEGDEHFYRCHDGRELRHIRTEHHKKEGYTQTSRIKTDCIMQSIRDIRIQNTV